MLAEQDAQGILDFLRQSERLKNTLRSAYTSDGRVESTAEHTWRLCLMVMLFEKQFPEIDFHRLLKICIVHDLGESIHGDIPAIEQVEGSNKSVQERQDLITICKTLPMELQSEILALWDEYENVSSAEARLAKAFDKLETCLQHTQGENPPDFNYGFNLGYGKSYTDFNEITAQLRALIDEVTRQKAKANNTL